MIKNITLKIPRKTNLKVEPFLLSSASILNFHLLAVYVCIHTFMSTWLSSRYLKFNIFRSKFYIPFLWGFRLFSSASCISSVSSWHHHPPIFLRCEPWGHLQLISLLKLYTCFIQSVCTSYGFFFQNST